MMKCYLSEFVNFMDILQEFYNKMESVSFRLFVQNWFDMIDINIDVFHFYN